MTATGTNAIEQPKLFTLSGRNISATVALSGFDGKPKVTYHDAQRVLSFSGDEITFEDGAVGTLTTVTIARIVDFGSTTFTAVLPRVNLIGNQFQIRTRSMTKSRIAGRALRYVHLVSRRRR